MLRIIRNLLERTNNVNRSTYIWNGINAMLSACICPVVLMVITRTNGIYDAGVFSIAFAVASLMIFIGQFGIRRFQASDVNEKYSFEEYHGMRMITCAAMLVISLLYCIYGSLFNDYDMTKFMVIFLVCILKIIQAYVDVIHGRMQQLGRLDVAAKSSAVRFFAEIVSYSAALIITENLLISTVACVIVSFIVMMLTTINASVNYGNLHIKIDFTKIRSLFIEGMPLFASLFLNMYISNAPKYAIDAYLTEDIQAIYNIIFMPAFMVGLVANFIFNPILTSYAKVWASKQISKFKKMVARQCIFIAGLTVAGLIVAATIGIPLLSLIFGVVLSAYKLELCVVMIGGGAMAYGVFFSTVITIARAQSSLLVIYGIVALAAKVLSGVLVTGYGIMGAATLYAISMVILCIMLFVVIMWKFRKEKSVLDA